LKLIVRGHKVVEPVLSRQEIGRIVADYVERHPRLKRCRTIVIRFSEDPFLVDGHLYSGLQEGNRISVSLRNKWGGRYDVFAIVACIYHELHHMTEDRYATACKGDLLKYYSPDEKDAEVRAIEASVEELARWSANRTLQRTRRELQTIASLADKWAIK
jgi:hypothetical protein